MKLTLVMAVTADGKIARHDEHFPDWTGKADKRMFKGLTEQAGVVIMGSTTYQTIGKPLPNRLNVVMTRRPGDYQERSNLVFTADPADQVLAALALKGYHTAVLAGGSTINSLFLRMRLINEMILTISPVIFGRGMSLFSDPADVRLELISSSMLDHHSVMLHYRFSYDTSGADLRHHHV